MLVLAGDLVVGQQRGQLGHEAQDLLGSQAGDGERGQGRASEARPVMVSGSD